ncbi:MULTISPECIES: sugar MFS transporter [Gammaproteobacteria]|uniref:sugar MFS transporter n=1 Tax=Gammaproteobacteria TaxID=1236 RepID=UPI000DD04DBD|nr:MULTISPECIES: sugar MFS transporter [Gammaproteobacteria]RTE86289.1 sugar MFS transporter [Aliidiomarina sp. B3213]TCZ91640.1 sugar MFS transporter [Lysobacter sp. N42]
MTNQNNNYRFALTALTSLFFMWGFITCMNDILIPYLKILFDLNYAKSMLIQFCFFGAYFIVSIPAGMLIGKIGYKNGIVTGLMIAGAGCVLFYPAAQAEVYGLFLLALFVLASGITILQVAANPYVTVLGAPETASSRLTMTQAFNSLGTTVAPLFGAWLIFEGVTDPEISGVSKDAVSLPYFILAATLVVMAAVFLKLKLPNMGKTNTASALPSQGSAWKQRHLVLGALGIFVYVGAEVSIGSFLAMYIALPEIGNMPTSQSSHYISWYFGGAMVGRFLGAAIMQRISGEKVLMFNALAAVLLLLTTMTSSGTLAMWALIFVGLCNSIMFPTIFSLALQNLGDSRGQGSGILCLAIVGGAIVPLLQGLLADQVGIQTAFVVPLVCYLYIAFYGYKGYKPQTKLQQSPEGETA